MGTHLATMRSVAALALVAGASAFAPMMSMDMGRRQVVQTAGAAAVAAPLLRTKEADAFFQDEPITPGKFEGFLSRAPVISIFDHRLLPQGLRVPRRAFWGPERRDVRHGSCPGNQGLRRDFSQVPAGGDLLPGQGNRRRLRRPVALRPRWRLFHLPDRGLQVNSRYARLCSIAEAGFLLSASCKVEATPREVWIEDSKVSCPSRLLSWCYVARGL